MLPIFQAFLLFHATAIEIGMSYDTPDQVYRMASGGGARIVDKYSKLEKTNSEIETKKETQNRDSAVPLHVKGYPLKLDALLS